MHTFILAILCPCQLLFRLLFRLYDAFKNHLALFPLTSSLLNAAVRLATIVCSTLDSDGLLSQLAPLSQLAFVLAYPCALLAMALNVTSNFVATTYLASRP
jgi:hypothetical protein